MTTSFSSLDAIFSSPSTHLQMALETLPCQYPLDTVQHLLTALGLPTSLLGERSSILKFTGAPLSFSLRITGLSVLSPSTAAQDRTCVHIHTERSTRKFQVASDKDLKAIARYVLHCKEEKEAATGYLRRAPMGDSALLDFLRTGKFCEVPRFAEAERAVGRGCLLDACVELLGPFGLQPAELDREVVVFGHKYLKGDDGVKITRLAGYVSSPEEMETDIDSDSTYGSLSNSIDFSSAVVVSGLKTADANQLDADCERRLPRVLRKAGVSFDEEAPSKGLVYALSAYSDLVALAKRILAYRNKLLANEDPFEEQGWTGKQYHEPIPLMSRQYLRRLACHRRKSALCNETLVETLLEDRRRDEEAKREEERTKRFEGRTEEMRREWQMKMEGDRRREQEKEQERKEQGKKSWADMVEEDEGDDFA
ncbi:hypothetical protein BU26DRAFT_569191 [Trematosphaeria pertusa]|uniref:Uncharacterized protein n=1 Tax=Trematosphaeria pertusa TaxID=390896 RepID=A0A6A6I2J6_9PLEO|nr:uncharacterized protein BU26DRAFT_569191 [Trematosphaeria pertusa]KAF2244192.1 hypothetical protein BU26DRAFT_569191 [Trematosphaeria pertusa]